MNPESAQRLESIFHAALECAPAQRGDFLNHACRGDQALRRDVESLLSADDSARQFLESPVLGPAQRSREPRADAVVAPGQRVGPFEIVRLLASGGMGTVYEAVQDHPRRIVALKLMRAGLASPTAQRRFQFESELLGRLQHPGIAQVYGAGTHDDGTVRVPYFAMEYLPGAQPILQYAGAHRLTRRARLELFAGICDAVHHAHTKGVIHRDLKPANILIMDAPGAAHGGPAAPVSKIVDFGVARATDADRTVMTLGIDAGQLVGTLQYMSPEQCDADPARLDTASDVYSLGVVLYELVCGQRPYEVSGSSLVQAIQTIRQQPPARPRSVCPDLDEDVETIVLKSLEKEPQRRYASASALGQDILRFLRYEPIEARRPSAAYQFRMFARRNRAVVLAGMVALTALVAGAVTSTVFAVQARRERAAAQLAEREEAAERAAAEAARAAEARQRTSAQRVTEFLQKMLYSADPNNDGVRDVTVREVLDRAGGRIEAELADEPAALAAVQDTMGRVYMNLALYDEAEQHLRAALRVRRMALGEHDVQVAATMSSLGVALTHKAKYEEAEALFREALSIVTAALGPRSEEVTGILNNLAGVMEGRGDRSEAEGLLRRALEIRREILGPEHLDVAQSLFNLAVNLRRQARLTEAEQLYRESLALRRKLLKPPHPDLAASLHGLASLLSDGADYADAEPLFREAMDMRRTSVGPRHPAYAASLNGLALLYRRMGKYRAAEPLYREALDINRARYGARHPRVATTLGNLAAILQRIGREDDADAALRESLEIRREALGPDHVDVADSLVNLARSHRIRGEFAQAEQAVREALRIYRHNHGDDHPQTAGALETLGGIFHARGMAKEAESHAREALAIKVRLLGEDHPEVAGVRYNLAAVVLKQGRPEEAIRLYEEALTAQRKTLPANNPDLAKTQSALADVLLSMGRPADAEPLLRAALAIQQQSFAPGHRLIALTKGRLGTCLTMLQRYDEAEPLLRSSHESLVNRKSHRPLIRESAHRLVALYEAWGRPADADMYRNLDSRAGGVSASQPVK